ncbi:MAG: glycosyltransferase family 4 protein [Anaerolineales bacterium]
MADAKRYIAAQFGARRAYAVPAILERAGMLEAFYTDLCGNVGAGLALSRLVPSRLQTAAIQRLVRREVPAEIKNKTVTFPLPTLRHVLRNLNGRYNSLLGNDLWWDQFDADLGRSMARRGLGQANHIFSMAGECLPFLEYARQHGAVIVTEFYSMPSRRNIEQDEWRRFPDLQEEPTDAYVQSYVEKQKKIRDLTDWFIAPSPHVIEDLVNNFGVPRDRCFMVPYAVHERWLEVQNEPEIGRVLFVGAANMGKGIHYLGMASQLLDPARYHFRVVGGIPPAVRQHPLCQGLDFAGFVMRSAIQQEYRQADVFTLPSLYEGSAEVIYEALACGIPVVTTPAAGSVVRDGVEGFIVPERDPQALAQRIQQIVEDRDLRARMARAARERARDHTWAQYAERLSAVFQRIP